MSSADIAHRSLRERTVAAVHRSWSTRARRGINILIYVLTLSLHLVFSDAIPYCIFQLGSFEKSRSIRYSSDGLVGFEHTLCHFHIDPHTVDDAHP